MKKIRFILFGALMLSAPFSGFTQPWKFKSQASFPIIADEGISSITATDDIDLILIQENFGKAAVKATDEVAGKLAVSVVDGRLFLSRAKGSLKNERLTVYAWVDDLENLTLTGTATAVSIGILQGPGLHVSATDETSVSLKSKDKVWFTMPVGYQVRNAKGDFYQYTYSSKD
jgi:hypothetical protein